MTDEYNQISSETIETIKEGCPICKGDVKGNDTYMFYCKQCNILFRKDELLLGKSQVEKILKKHIAEKYESADLNDELSPINLKNIPAGIHANTRADKKEKKDINELGERFYLASKKSDIVHLNNCPYARNIKKANRIVFENLSKAKGYRRCTCII